MAGRAAQILGNRVVWRERLHRHWQERSPAAPPGQVGREQAAPRALPAERVCSGHSQGQAVVSEAEQRFVLALPTEDRLLSVSCVLHPQVPLPHSSTENAE